MYIYIYTPYAPWCCYIYLQNWVILFGANVGKYSSIFQHHGAYGYWNWAIATEYTNLIKFANFEESKKNKTNHKARLNHLFSQKTKPESARGHMFGISPLLCHSRCWYNLFSQTAFWNISRSTSKKQTTTTGWGPPFISWFINNYNPH